MPAASALPHRLEQSLVLLDDYLHPLFGAEEDVPRPFLNLKRQLGEGLAEGYDANGRSYLAARLAERYRGAPADLWTYDDNIRRHLAAINAARPQDEQIVLKYFQHLALFYTEHVLHRFYTQRADFLAELNTLVAARNANERRAAWHFAPYSDADLSKLAFWMATGSGKTLLLHLNYHQILHYSARAKAAPFDNILLITPNAGLSQQHLREFELSGIPAVSFRSGQDAAAGVVQVIEITKFTEGAKGPQTVAVSEFEGNNLIFVDEGHRGASGDVWVNYRDKLAKNGFTFEYSATFGEALNKGSGAADVQTRRAYGKAIVFDYSYRYFYRDGYGKDYTLVNLPRGYKPGQQDTLLLANLLTFCQQIGLFLDEPGLMRTYNIERPLLMFVGHTVQTGKKRSEITGEDRQTLSDVLDIVRFLHRVAAEPDWAKQTIAHIFRGTANLTDATGRDLFANSFPYLPTGVNAAADTYALLLDRIFHAPASGPLHLARLRNAPGEISLRIGTAEFPFGVINIGDDSNFVAMAQEANLGLVIENEDALRTSLFEKINRTDSTINILVGAKKFTEGWSSWRVSGMGLLNVGRSEGSEVIQMFGRGVRLLGYARTLKRSSVLEGSHPSTVPLLEKLNIFSINGDYLAQFRASLDREGIPHDIEEIHVPVQFNFFDAPAQLAGTAQAPPLYVVRLQNGADFSRSGGFSLEPDGNARAEIDLRVRLQVESSQAAAGGAVRTSDTPLVISEGLLDLLDWDAIMLDLLVWRRQRGFVNMAFDRATLRELLKVDANGRDTPYYLLHGPASLVDPKSYAQLGELQVVVLAILRKYAERYYHLRQRAWESRRLEYRVLDRSDPNLQLVLHEDRSGYLVKISRDRTYLINLVSGLVKEANALYAQDAPSLPDAPRNPPPPKLPSLVFDRHLYQPLLAHGFYSAGAGSFEEMPDIVSVPTGLNRGEARFVVQLRAALQDPTVAARLGNRQIYLLRNLSRARGIGFFAGDSAASTFYPDFILWVISGTTQKIVFIDPKGLHNLEPRDFSNYKVRLFKELRNSLSDIAMPEGWQIELDSYLISDKGYDDVRRGFGGLAPGDGREKFDENHILFPDRAADDLLQLILA